MLKVTNWCFHNLSFNHDLELWLIDVGLEWLLKGLCSPIFWFDLFLTNLERWLVGGGWVPLWGTYRLCRSPIEELTRAPIMPIYIYIYICHILGNLGLTPQVGACGECFWGGKYLCLISTLCLTSLLHEFSLNFWNIILNSLLSSTDS